MPYRDSPHHEIELVMSFSYLSLFEPTEDTEDYHITKPNYEIFLFEIEVKKYVYVGEKVLTFETNDIILNHSVDLGFTDIKFSRACGEENIYFMLYQNYIPFEDYETSTEKKRV